MKNVLILCTGNSARSILGEALVNHLGGGRLRGFSAGSQPKEQPHRLALEILAAHGLPAEGYRSKSWKESAAAGAPKLAPTIPVCESPAGEACRVWPGTPAAGHWGLPDPAAATGSEAERRAAFETAYRQLAQRISRLAALDLDAMTGAEIKTALADIHRSSD